MTRFLIGAAVSLGMAAWLYRLVFRYREHVTVPEFRKAFADLPNPREAGKR